MDPFRDVEILVRSRHPVIVIESVEEERVEEGLREVAYRLKVPLFRWSINKGLIRDGLDAPLYDSKEPKKALDNIEARRGDGIYLLADVHPFLEDAAVARKLREVARHFAGKLGAIVLMGVHVALPPDLERIVVRVRLALPGREDLDTLVGNVVTAMLRRGPVRVDISKPDYERLLDALQGLTRAEAERAIGRAVVEDGALTGADVARVVAVKREQLARGGLLEFLPPEDPPPAFGGLAGLKAWLEKRRRSFTDEARRFGLPPPRGVLLLGVQGCGKSLAAKAVARLWGLPLLKLEAGRLYDKWLGESEKNLERVLESAERMAPCVLWIDEIEKGFASVGASDADGGLSLRLLGRLLSWLQEHKAAVFVAATCNSVDQLPPELMRKGRFDELFFVDLPTREERSEIFRLHLAARGRAPEGFDLDVLSDASPGFSGAEIEQAVVAALHSAFAAGGELTTDLLRHELETTRPLSVTRREEVEALRAWARGRAVPAA